MAYNFKSIADVEVVKTPTETANILIEEDGVIKKVPKTTVGGSNGLGGYDLIAHQINTQQAEIVYGSYTNVVSKLENGEFPIIQILTDFLKNDNAIEYSLSNISTFRWYKDDEYLWISFNNGERLIKVYPDNSIVFEFLD